MACEELLWRQLFSGQGGAFLTQRKFAALHFQILKMDLDKDPRVIDEAIQPHAKDRDYITLDEYLDIMYQVCSIPRGQQHRTITGVACSLRHHSPLNTMIQKNKVLTCT